MVDVGVRALDAEVMVDEVLSCCRTGWMVTAATSGLEVARARDVAAGVIGVVGDVQVVGVGVI
ncbi:MAG: hypothetical protein M0Z30_08760, partial [Actinomycetota bacterium]|nr:hypothetical protein [Actinomycetota bacterium]